MKKGLQFNLNLNIKKFMSINQTYHNFCLDFMGHANSFLGIIVP